MLQRRAMLAFAAGAYVIALASLAYIVGFLADFGVPKSINDGEPTSLWLAVLIDAGLVGLFGFHHSITARTSFKRWWTRIIPAPIERATYLYMTAVMTAMLVIFWRPIPITVWDVKATGPMIAIYAVYLSVWVMMSAATFHFGHFGFFGLAQAWQDFRQRPLSSSNMTARYLYALVRHPISLGWMTTPWVTPHLTVGHTVFAIAVFAYIMVATSYEEADLIEDLGDDYRRYREQVPSFVPGIKPNPGSPISEPTRSTTITTSDRALPKSGDRLQPTPADNSGTAAGLTDTF